MILGVDLGQRTTGLAVSHGTLASPYKTIFHKNINQALASVTKAVEDEQIDTVVVGFVEGQIKPFFEKFAQQLKSQNSNLNVVLWDETLTSRQATESMVKLGVKKHKRAKKEHEVAAALILQSYLDSSE